MSTHILGVVRLLVLTSIIVTAASAVAGTQVDPLCHLGDRASGAVVSGALDQEIDRRPGVDTPVPALVTLIAPLLPAAAAGTATPVPVTQAPAASAVIAFAPKTSPPRARWF